MELDTRCHIHCNVCDTIIGIRFFKAEFDDWEDHGYKDIQCTNCFVADDTKARDGVLK